jgi:hypothetical protein
MSRYLEEAARVLKTAEQNANEVLSSEKRSAALVEIASGFATLAAIDKGLLPADITRQVLDQLTRTT